MGQHSRLDVFSLSGTLERDRVLPRNALVDYQRNAEGETTTGPVLFGVTEMENSFSLGVARGERS
jgi:hypothetical protein